MRDALLRLIADCFRRLPDPFSRFPDEWKRASFRQEEGRYIRGVDSDWKPGPKVFGIGLSKTGTTSLNYALQHLGYNSLHWRREGKVLGWPEFLFADAATDAPCCVQFESLYHTFDESKFIYTVRDVEDWKQSIIQHYAGKERPSELRREGERRWLPEGAQWRFYSSIRKITIHECLYAQHDSWEEAYQAFDHRVRTFFEDKPDDRFLEMRIPEGDGWDLLCSFLGHQVPDSPFPHQNKST